MYIEKVIILFVQAQLWMYDATTMKLKNKNGPWEFSDETFSNFPQNSGDTSSVLTDEAKVLNAVSGKLVVF